MRTECVTVQPTLVVESYLVPGRLHSKVKWPLLQRLYGRERVFARNPARSRELSPALLKLASITDGDRLADIALEFWDNDLRLRR